MRLGPVPRGFLLGLVLLAMAGASHAGPAGTWRILPPAIGNDPTVFDEAGGRIFRADFDHLWVRETATGSRWRRIELPPTGLTSRSGPCLVYDPARDRLLLFGGNASGSAYADVWSLPLEAPNPAWALLATSGTPPSPRSYAAGIVDVARERLVVFGGSQTSDLWALTLGDVPTWSQLAPSGAGPSPRTRAVAALDAKRDRMILYGGTNLNDAWSFDLAGARGWQGLAAPAQALPPYREQTVGCVDPVRDRLVLFGGLKQVSLGDVWFLSLATGLWSTGPTGPPARSGGGIGYDAVADRLLLTGGTCSPRYTPTVPDPIYPLGDLWEFRTNAASGAWTELESSPVYGSYGDLWDSLRRRMIVITPLAVTNPSPGDGSAIIPQSPGYWAMAPDSGWTFHAIPFYGGPTNAIWTYDPVTDRYLGFQPPTQLWAIDPKTDYLSVERLDPPADLELNAVSSSAFDLSQRRVVFVGGRRDPVYQTVTADAWTMGLDPPHTWEAILPTGTAPVLTGEPLLEDPARNRWILFDTAILALDPSPHWESLELTVPWPYYQGGSRYTHDPRRDRYIGYGAEGLLLGSAVSFLREWAPGEPGWSLLTPEGPASLARIDQAQVYDGRGDRILVYGGRWRDFNPTETWELKWSDPPQPRIRPDGDVIWAAGRATTISFTIDNESAAGGDVAYRLTDSRQWPGLPKVGVVHLPGSGSATLDLQVDVPDSAAAGINWMHFWVGETAVPAAGDSCDRRTYDLTTPTRLGLVESDATVERVRLVWWTPDGPGMRGVVERRVGTEDELEVGAVESDGAGRLVFEDRSAPRGERVSYRLRFAGPGGMETTDAVEIDVPAVRFAVRAVRRPERAGVVILLSLPTRAETTLDLFDVTGRQRAHARVPAALPGSHEIELPGTENLPSGLYFARATHAGQTARGRVIHLRER